MTTLFTFPLESAIACLATASSRIIEVGSHLRGLGPYGEAGALLGLGVSLMLCSFLLRRVRGSARRRPSGRELAAGEAAVRASDPRQTRVATSALQETGSR
jgi:hypothetical protein